MNGRHSRLEFEKQYIKKFHLTNLKSLKTMMEYESWNKTTITELKFGY